MREDFARLDGLASLLPALQNMTSGPLLVNVIVPLWSLQSASQMRSRVVKWGCCQHSSKTKRLSQRTLLRHPLLHARAVSNGHPASLHWGGCVHTSWPGAIIKSFEGSVTGHMLLPVVLAMAEISCSRNLRQKSKNCLVPLCNVKFSVSC